MKISMERVNDSIRLASPLRVHFMQNSLKGMSVILIIFSKIMLGQLYLC